MLLEDYQTNNVISIQQLLSRENYQGIQFDSRKVKVGELFIAISGTAFNGHDFIDDAIKNGASSIIGEKEILNLPIPYYKCSNARLALALAASEFYHHPWKRPIMVGITGTNGKTTTSYMLRHILETNGYSCGLIGTVQHIINGKEIASNQTTPNPLVLQELIAESSDDIIIMEVSSHGLHQDRVSGLKFDYAIFTNLSHDHLDYHQNLSDYFKVKSRLFSLLKDNGEAIIGTYTSWGKELTNNITIPSERVFTFGNSIENDIELIEWNQAQQKSKLRIFTEHITLSLPSPGLHNLWNAMGASLLANRLNISTKDIKQSFTTFLGVPGRFETFHYDHRATTIVDYAHTPDGLEQCLKTAKFQCMGRLFHIFGFRGDRDKSKRKSMLSISSFYCDVIILTMDDLNNENIENMTEEMKNLTSTIPHSNFYIILDRTKAIEYAWKHSKQNDVIMITGKGPETYKHTFAYPCKTDQETVHFLYNMENDLLPEIRHYH